MGENEARAELERRGFAVRRRRSGLEGRKSPPENSWALPLFLRRVSGLPRPWAAAVGGGPGERGGTAQEAINWWCCEMNYSLSRKVGLSTTEPGSNRESLDRLERIRASFEGVGHE